jgi:CBS domain-containing protein
MIPKVIPDVVSGQTIRALQPASSALEAARLMREHDISAVVILDEAGRLIGIVTERDIARRVAADDRVASSMRLADVMSPNPVTVSPVASPYEALETMRKLRVRHLPVAEGGHVVGMVSMRDLRSAIAAASGARPKGSLRRLLQGLTGEKPRP